PRCKMAFSCSTDHWDAARSRHEAPCDELPGRLSQCEMNIQIRVDGAFRTVMTAPRLRACMWQFIRRQEAWTPLKGLTWESVIGGNVRTSLVGAAIAKHTPACIRLVASLASTVFTALYALEELNISTAWTKKSTLTIHILGGPPDFDPSIAYLYETILHHVPNVQFLNVFSFIGPDYSSDQQWRSANAVPEEGQSSIIIPWLHSRNYEDYVQSEGAAFQPPDLAVATNCFLTTTDPDLWRRTIKMLVARHIPSVFTAYDRRWAARDLVLMRESGANPIPSLTLVKNPWGAQNMTPNFGGVHGFHAPNAWLTGGFS
ncbi:hypothetical protein K438DRAFT_2160909, partial [Mycena galopus ATCC 62051]